MWLHWPGLGRMVGGRCFDAPDAIGAGPGANGGGAAADGSHPSSDAHAVLDDGAADAGDGQGDLARAAGAADDDDDLDTVSDDELADLPFKDHPRFRALLKKNRKLARRMDRIGKERETYLTKASAFDRVEAAMQSANPALWRHLRFGEPLDDTPPATGREPSRPSARPPAFDPDNLPFDKADPVGAFLVSQFQTLYAQLDELRTLKPQVETLDRTLSGAREAAQTKLWRSAAEAAANEFPEEVRGMFLDAVWGAMQTAKQRGQRITPQQVIDHYVSKVKASRSQKARASDAAAQATARANQQLPRPGALTGGTPAPPRDRSQDTVRSVSARLMGGRKAPGGYV